MYQYTSDVIANLKKCAAMVGAKAEEDFDQDVFCELGDLKIESPIEQLFYTSFKLLLKINSIAEWEANTPTEFIGMNIIPQSQILSYRVDFHISWFGYMWRSEPMKAVVVECDSQEWHERTEKERRYEKRRDRELAKIGLYTFRFTGKEIKENPFNPAIEVCSFLTGLHAENLLEILDYIETEVL